ncbi:MAG: 30S ribosomal protein S2 [candidate division Zixibacteria bacterium]|jgi:small subunit ribosomal protein S2|nr:30S ribosomal protein S2 [candidate division Zixibacteria bacterium]
MLDITIKDLLEAGVHFGHQTRRWNPKMKRFIFTAKNGIYIIDLKKTMMSMERAIHKVNEIVTRGHDILFVGTKKQAKDVIREEAIRCGQYYVCERWLGGMLTNFQTIKKNIKRLKDLERMKEDGTFEKLSKKEVSGLEREMAKLQKVLGGIKEMNRLPGLLFVVDAKKEKIAVAEASKLEIPIISIIDTNSDPDPIDFPIAGNDDAIKSIKIITSQISNSVIEAANRLKEGAQIAEKSEQDKTASKVEAPSE